MLAANNRGVFRKKVTVKITFVYNLVFLAKQAIQNVLARGEGQIFWMKSIGTNQNGEHNSKIDFDWSIRIKSGKTLKRITSKT
jgi:hypothetical protein